MANNRELEKKWYLKLFVGERVFLRGLLLAAAFLAKHQSFVATCVHTKYSIKTNVARF